MSAAPAEPLHDAHVPAWEAHRASLLRGPCTREDAELFMRTDLAKSGLVPADVNAALEPVPAGADAFSGGPRFVGYRLPYWTGPAGATHPAMYRVRLIPTLDAKPPKYTQPSIEELTAPPGESKEKVAAQIAATLPYFNPHCLGGYTRDELLDPARGPVTYRWVEGEKKTASAGLHLGLLAIGIGGCWQAILRAERIGEPGANWFVLHPALVPLLHPGDTVELLIDADVRSNEQVAVAVGTTRRVLLGHGVQVTLVLLPESIPGLSGKVGIDDWIRSRPAATVQEDFAALPRMDLEAAVADGALPEHRPTLYHALGLALNKYGVPIAHESNVQRVLCRHERYTRNYWFDVVRSVVMRGKSPVTDETATAEAAWLQAHLGWHMVRRTHVLDGLVALCDVPAFQRNPLLDAIAAIPWDRVERLETMFIRACGTPDTPFARAVGRNWLVSAVARLAHPGCKVDTMLVLEGPQGLGKSQWLEIMGGDGYVASNENLDGKDFLLSAHRGWIVDLLELAGLKRGDQEYFKGLLSAGTDVIRAPYGRLHKEQLRHFVFVGTSNTGNYLLDDTGGRRYWPIACLGVVAIRDEDGTVRKELDLEWARANRDQLLAEALWRYREWERTRDAAYGWWRVPVAAATREQEARRAEHPWEAPIAGMLAEPTVGRPVGVEGRFVATGEILHRLGVPPERQTRAHTMIVAAIVPRLGWIKHRYRGTPLYFDITEGGPVALGDVRGYLQPGWEPAATPKAVRHAEAVAEAARATAVAAEAIAKATREAMPRPEEGK